MPRPPLLDKDRLLRGPEAALRAERPAPLPEPPPGLLPPPEEGPGKPLRVGALAKASGKTVRALHLYEELGLLKPQRSKGGYRLYGAGSVTRVAWISRLQDMGFSLPEIRGLLEEWQRSATAKDAMQRVTELYRQKLAATRAQAERLAELGKELEAGLGYLETCESCEPARVVSACASCDRRDCGDHAPVLVAGFTTN